MNTLFTLLYAIFGILISCSPFWLWPVCSAPATTMGHMNCWYMGVMVVALGLSVCILAFICFISKNFGFQVISWLFSAVVSVVIRLSANGVINISGQGWRVALCGIESMSCRSVMLPHVSWLAIGLCITSSLWAICSLVIGKR